MKIVLHAGSLKTGSTYLQSLIWRNLPAFASAGVHIPTTGVLSEHHYNIARAAGFGYPALRLTEDEADVFLRDISAELAAGENEVALLSSEHFDLGVSPDSVARLQASLVGHELKVVIYLRNQVDLIQSLYFENLKWGGISEFPTFAAQQLRNGTLACDTRIAHWINAGIEVCALDYNQEKVALAAGFLGLIPNAPPLDSLTKPSNGINESLAPEAMEHLRRINLLVSNPDERRLAYVDLYKRLHKRRSQWTKSRQLPLPTALIDALPALSVSNRRLAEMIGKGVDFLQGDLVAYAAQRGGEAYLDMDLFYETSSIAAPSPS